MTDVQMVTAHTTTNKSTWLSTAKVTELELATDVSVCSYMGLLIYICSHNNRPVATYRAGTAMAVPHLWGTRTSEYAKVGVVVTTTQYGRTTSNCLLQSRIRPPL